MKKTTLLLLGFWWSVAAAAPFGADEEQVLIDKVKVLQNAYEKGDLDSIATMTFEPVIAQVGGVDALKKVSQQVIDQAKRMGVVTENLEVGKPTPPLESGEYLVTFVPKTSTVKMGDKRAKSSSFMIGARRKDQTEWKFMDGAGLRKNPQLLHSFFPDLPKDVALPPNEVRLIQ
ncbi:MAG: hypothetical protein JNM60_04420 [Candidatus Competibacteraceae bacterium]|nr:hypothetical protein [Candidatus Competibacteraceae bacterium]